MQSLKDDGLVVSGILWKFELYFNADWKFLAMCLGLNGPTSKYFCPWCLCSKDQHGNLNQDWHIEKNIEQITTNYSNINGQLVIFVYLSLI